MSDCLSTFQQAPENIHMAIITYALNVRGIATLSRWYVDVWVKRWKKTTTLAESLQSNSIQLWDSTKLAATGSMILWITGWWFLFIFYLVFLIFLYDDVEMPSTALEICISERKTHVPGCPKLGELERTTWLSGMIKIRGSWRTFKYLFCSWNCRVHNFETMLLLGFASFWWPRMS